MAGASVYLEATAKETRKLVNPASHMDLWIRKRRGSTSSTINGTALRADHRIHKLAATIFSGKSMSKTRIRQEFTFQF